MTDSLSSKMYKHLTDERFLSENMFYEKDVKQHIQNAQKRIEAFIEIPRINHEIFKIFKEEFGDKLVGVGQ